MLAILVSWIVGAFVFLSFGKLFIRLFNIGEQRSVYSVADTFFIGLSLVGSILTIASLFIPLTGFVLLSLVVLSVGICIYEYFLDRTGTFFKDIYLRINNMSLPYKVAIIICVFFVLILSLLPPLIYDTGLYHLQAMMWLESYPVVPGLGNIHGRLAFNSNALLLHSVFSVQDIFGARIYGVQGITLFVLFGWIIYYISKSSFISKLALVVFIAGFYICYNPFISSPSTDLLPNAIIAYILLRAVFDYRTVTKIPLLYWIAPVFCLTLKLSMAPACIFGLVILWQLFKDKQYKRVAGLIFIALLIFVPWCIRNIIMSGYLIYPFPAIDIFSFDWKMPIALVEEEKAWVTSWARMPNIPYEEVFNMPFWVWGKSWLLRHIWFFRSALFIICLAAISPVVIFCLFKQKLIENKLAVYAWLIALCGYVFWFVLGPDARFGFSFVLVAALVPFIMMKPIAVKPCLKKIPELALIIVLISCSVHSFWLLDENKGDRTYLSFFYMPQTIDFIKDNGYQGSIEYVPHQLDSIIIYTPTFMNQCFECPIPCAPSYSNNIEMRGASMADGFRPKKIQELR